MERIESGVRALRAVVALALVTGAAGQYALARACDDATASAAGAVRAAHLAAVSARISPDRDDWIGRDASPVWVLVPPAYADGLRRRHPRPRHAPALGRPGRAVTRARPVSPGTPARHELALRTTPILPRGWFHWLQCDGARPRWARATRCRSEFVTVPKINRSSPAVLPPAGFSAATCSRASTACRCSAATVAGSVRSASQVVR